MKNLRVDCTMQSEIKQSFFQLRVYRFVLRDNSASRKEKLVEVFLSIEGKESNTYQYSKVLS